MSLVFETIQTEGIAVLSYLIGDDGPGVAAVIDPCADVDRYVELARKKKVAITHVLETHIHADLVSGACELRERLGGDVKVAVSCEGAPKYGFPHLGVQHGDRFEFGSVLLVARHTPGHTPEHMAYLIHDKERPEFPWGVFSGDSLFVNSAGRPDLLGESESEKLAEQQFHTLRDFYLSLPDSVMIYPAHGHGSPCGAEIGERLTSAIGYERRFNEFLQFQEVKAFTRHALDSAPPVPTYYPRMKKLNAHGPEILGGLPTIKALPAKAFKKALEETTDGLTPLVIDTRHMLAFGGGHIPGAVSIGAEPMLSLWAGWLLEPATPILLVVEEDKLELVQRLFVRTGYHRFAGYLVGGMKAWDNAGFELAHVGQLTVHDIRQAGSSLQLVDVRSPAEWEKGHIPNAVHVFLPQLTQRAGELDPGRPTAVYCDSGYRASIGASLLKRAGFQDVSNVPGSWQAWKKMEYPVARNGQAAAAR